eukprot:12022763-Alexandrium_andersonii.AAC.1
MRQDRNRAATGAAVEAELQQELQSTPSCGRSCSRAELQQELQSRPSCSRSCSRSQAAAEAAVDIKP